MRFSLGFALCFSLLLAACGGSADAPETSTTAPAEGTADDVGFTISKEQCQANMVTNVGATEAQAKEFCDCMVDYLMMKYSSQDLKDGNTIMRSEAAKVKECRESAMGGS